jgi:hypothetical protein
VGTVRNRPVAAVDERDDLVAEVRVIATGAGGVDELAAAVGRPRIDVDDDRWGRLAAGEDCVRGLEERLAERGPVAPHGQLTGVPLDDVDARVAAVWLVVVAGWEVDPERSLMWVTERVAAQQRTVDDVLVDPSGELSRPGQHVAHSSHAAAPYDKSRARWW